MSAEQDREPALSQASMPAGAVFLSYASDDAAAAERIAVALRSAGIQVWFDREELRGGDAWDRQIRKQIHDCALFIPLISQHSQERLEGYFRLEWKLAVDRSHRMAAERSFIVPVVVDSTRERGALVPESFRDVQWTHLPAGEVSPPFVARVAALLGAPAPVANTAGPSPTPVTARPARMRNLRVVWIPLGLVALSIVIGAGWFALQHSGLRRHAEAGVSAQSQPAGTEKSIAVLPFVDLSEKHDQQYFADGMAEEILNLLVQIPQLKVIGRTSSFSLGKGNDLRAIGAALGTTYIVEGSVRRAGDHVRVTAQLIDTRDGTDHWSETYTRDASDVLKVQGEIAASLVRALQLEVTESIRIRTQTSLRNREVYDIYLRGMRAMDRIDLSGFEEAVADFRQALALDPSFVPAAEALARSLRGLVDWGLVPSRPGWEQARAAAVGALKLDPNSADAHAVLGRVYSDFDWDWPSAERELGTALALAPNSPLVLYLTAAERLSLGQYGEALRFVNAAIAADPLDPTVHLVASWVYLRLGRFAEAESANRRVLEIAPTFVTDHYYLGIVLLMEGKREEALTEMQKETPAGGREAGLAVVYEALHRRKDAETALARLEAESAGDMAMEIAEAYAFRGQKEQAFEWLDRAYAQKDINLFYIKGDPLLKNLEGDPRYKAFLRKMNLPE